MDLNYNFKKSIPPFSSHCYSPSLHHITFCLGVVVFYLNNCSTLISGLFLQPLPIPVQIYKQRLNHVFVSLETFKTRCKLTIHHEETPVSPVNVSPSPSNPVHACLVSLPLTPLPRHLGLNSSSCLELFLFIHPTPFIFLLTFCDHLSNISKATPVDPFKIHFILSVAVTGLCTQ